MMPADIFSTPRRPADGARMGHRPLLRLAMGALVIMGVVLIGQGAWIKAKAALSQLLLDQAFERTIERTAPSSSSPAEAEKGKIVPPGFHQVRATTPLPSFASASSQGTTSGKPWPWADIRPLARLEAAGLGHSAIVLDAVSGEALAFGPGHVATTPLPGEEGTSVLSGHRDTHFAWIRHLRPGDTVALTLASGLRHEFSMRRAWIARHDNSGIDPYAPGRLLALTTCWPFEAKTRGPMRYIVELGIVEDKVQTAAR